MDAGRLRQEDSEETLPIVELRDGLEPAAFRVEGSDCLRRIQGDPGSAAVQILIRPEGVLACLGPEYRKPPVRLEFAPFPVSGALRVGPLLVRVTLFDVPEWVPAELEERAR